MTVRKRFDAAARTSAIAVFEDELKTRSDGYVEHLAHGGKADCGEEFYLDALHMAIAALMGQEERSKGCSACDGGFGDNTMVFYAGGYKHCPMCGRRLEEA